MTKLKYAKTAKLLLGIFVFFLITYLFFDLVFDLSDRLSLYIKDLPATIGTALGIVLLLIADVIIPIPASIVTVASGMLFGGFLGGLIVLVGSLTGSIINFQISRSLGQTRVKRWLGDSEYNNLSSIMKKTGAYMVILTRAVPLAMESVSSISGVSDIKLREFILLNIVGFVPSVFFYSYAGAIFESEPWNLVAVLFIGFFVPLIIWFLLLKLIQAK
jgi:uncharacterized membrane protein YdjX (TVP38/TMEM64 family)